MPDIQRVYVRVGGLVQGVGFRYFAQRTARRLGLVGFVRNLPSGEVELEAEGPEEAVSELVDRVKAGPSGARVRAFFLGSRPVAGREYDFEIRFF